VPFFLNLEKIVDGGTSDKLTNVNIRSIVVFGGMSKNDLANNVVYFGANGVTILQSLKTNVNVQLINKHYLFLVGIHYMAHNCNINVNILSSLIIFAKIETLFACMYTFYN
jgi:hypothetical protein